MISGIHAKVRPLLLPQTSLPSFCPASSVFTFKLFFIIHVATSRYLSTSGLQAEPTPNNQIKPRSEETKQKINLKMNVFIEPVFYASVRQSQARQSMFRHNGATQTGPPLQASSLHPSLIIRERQGTMMMVPETLATASGITDPHLYRKIILRFHLYLRMNGFLGQIITLMQGVGIHVLIVSGYYYDILYVPISHMMVAIDILAIMTNIAYVECRREPWDVEFVDTEGFEFQDLPE